ncbi:MAG: hypothetical protein ACLFQM_05935 [Fidelibacterota bacterium]
MKYLKKKLISKDVKLLIGFLSLLLLSNCARFIKPDLENIPDLRQNCQSFNQTRKIEAKGNIIIDTPFNDGKINAVFNLKVPDSLDIQFRDVIGRKQAFMKFYNDDFDLWMQRENRHLGRHEIPPEFSLFVFNELSLIEIRKIFFAQPLFNTKNINYKKLDYIQTKTTAGQNVTTFFNDLGLIRRVEIYEGSRELSSIFVYSDYDLYGQLVLPGVIQIIDLNKAIEVEINLYHFSVESINLSGIKKRGYIAKR